MSIAMNTARTGKKWPYLLILPSLVALALILGYPIFKLINLSLQKYGLFEIIAGRGKSQ